MTIEAAYDSLRLPRNLRRHMYRVAAVGEYLAEQANSFLSSHPAKMKVSVADIRMTLLCHDLGNLLKFDLSRGVDLFDVDERDVIYWKSEQLRQAEKYGAEVHAATLAMAEEIGISERVRELLKGMGSSQLLQTVQSADWELKICVYSDFRVRPDGFVSVTERFDDIAKRYAGRAHYLAERESTLMKRDLCLELESQLQSQFEYAPELPFLPERALEIRVNELSTVPVGAERLYTE